MSLNLGIIASSRSSAPSVPLLLDTYPGAAAAYSLRKLRTAYTGAAIRVRRDRDNTEQDIGFNLLGELDTVALQSFVGSENYIYWSQDFTQSIWTKTAVTVTANAGTAPDGTNTAQKCVPSAAVTTKAIFQTLTSVSTRDYVFSMYAKAAEYNFMQLLAIRDSTNRYSIIVDLTTGAITQTNTVGTPNFINSSVTSVGNGWYRIVITLNINLGTNYFVFSPSPVSNPTLNGSLDLQSAGNGSSGVLFWGAQLNYFALRPYQATTTLQFTLASGFITTWYDQSGNGRNAVQSTTANQPTIVLSGSIYTINSKPAALFNGTSTELRTSTIASWLTATPYTFILVDRVNNIKNDNYFCGTAGVLGLTDRAVIAGYRSGSQVTLSQFNDDANFSFTQVQQQKLHNIYFKFPNSEYFINNTSLGTQTNPANGANITDGGFQIGRAYGEGVLYYSGYLQEVVAYQSNQFTNRTGINLNINSYYTIY